MRWESFKRVSGGVGRRVSSALAAAIFTCGIATAQIDPHTQIRWPSNCSTAGMVYSFELNSCILNGTGGESPGGPATAVQANNGAGGFAGYATATLSANGDLSAASLNGAIDPAQCAVSPAPSWCAGTDIFGFTNAAEAHCSGACSIVIPPGTYNGVTTTLNCLTGMRLSAYGATVNYTGTGNAILCTNVEKATVEGLKLVGPSATGTTQGLVVGSNNGLGQTISNTFRDMWVTGFGKGVVVDGGTNSGTYYNLFEQNASGALNGVGGNGIGWYLVPSVSDHANDNTFIRNTAIGNRTHGWQIDGVLADTFTADESEANNVGATIGYGFYLPGTMLTEYNTWSGGYTETNTDGIYCGSATNVRENVFEGIVFVDGIAAGGPCSGALTVMDSPGNGTVDRYSGPFLYHINTGTGAQYAFAVQNDETPPSGLTDVIGVTRTSANNGLLYFGTPEYPASLRSNLLANGNSLGTAASPAVGLYNSGISHLNGGAEQDNTGTNFPIYLPGGSTGGSTYGTNVICWTGSAQCAATSGANQNSPYVGWEATYWNGSASAIDSWSSYISLGTGANPTSTLNFVHGGSTGFAAVQVPQFIDSALGSSTSPVCPNGTGGALTTSGCTGSGGGGYTNLTGSGTQTTVAAINTACSGGTFYATTPLSIATGGTVTCPVQFIGAGIWTIATGQTVTFSKSVSETDGVNQIFAGPGTVTLSAATPMDHAEWFGAKGDCSTDDSAAIQEAINAAGGNQATIGANAWSRVQLLAKCYVIGTGLSITSGQLQFLGIAQGETPGGTVNTAGSVVKTTSASLNQISIIGPSSSSTAWIAGDAVQWITFSRTVAPTGTATTITIENAVAPIITHNLMLDAVRMMYMYNVSTGETGMIENNKLAWTSIGGCATDYGVYIDYTLGTTPTLHISYNEVSEPPLTPCSSAYGMYVNGNPQDLMVDHFETAALGYGNYVNGSGGAGTHTDNHFVDNIHDQCQVSCYYVTGIVNGSTAEASITIQGGWADCNSSTNACIDIEGSSGISVTGVTIYNNQQTGKEVYVNGGFGNIVTSNKFLNIGANATGALLNNTAENIFSHNTIQGASTTGSIGLSLTSANRNRIDGNVFADVMGTGVSMDSASNYNDLSSTNLIAKANIPTPVSNAGANAIGPSGSANIGSFVTWSGCTTNGNSTSCVVSGSAAASITISAIPGWFHDLIIRFNGVSGSNTNRTINVQFNGDVTAGHYQWTCMQQAAASWSSCSSSNSDTSIANAFITGGTNAGDASSGTFTVLGYSGATFAKTTKTAAVYFASGGTPATITSYDVGGLWTGTAAITSVTLTCTGNCAVGSTFEIYGTN